MLIITIVLGKIFDDISENEKITKTQVYIYPQAKTFIMPDEVGKLINVNNNKQKNVDVKHLEITLEQNGYISNAEVYKDLNGRLVAEVQQYKPMARIVGKTSYYLDEEGNKKPLSKYYTEKVILVFGNINSNQKKNLVRLIKQIHKDKMLDEIVSEIHINNQNIWLKTDRLTADIKIDLNEDTADQLYKLKVIYSYLVKQNKTKKYRHIDLRYTNQAVCK